MNFKHVLIAAAVIGMPVSQQVQASFLGAVDGRGADLSAQANIAVEVNSNTFDDDSSWTGLRFNYKVNDGLVLFADASRLSVDDVPLDTITVNYDGQSFGAGFVYQLSSFFGGFDTSISASIHTADIGDTDDLTFGGVPFDTNLELTVINANLLFSPQKPLLDNGLSWYASVGYSQIDAEIAADGFESIKGDTGGFAGGIGLYLPVSLGELYLGVESIDGDQLAGAGFRYGF